MKVSGVILSGGKNSRFGSNKALIEINGKRIIDNLVANFKETFDEVIIVTNSPEEYLYLDTILVSDIYKDCGSLGGLFSGLYYADNSYIFVSACDMPFVKNNIIKHLLLFIGKYDVIVPKINGEYEPLFAIYSKKCLPFMERLIKNKDFKIINFFGKVKLKEVTETEIALLDPEFKAFVNINTKEELKKHIRYEQS